MVFVIDGSTSVGFDDFKISIKFIISIIDAFPVTPWGVHIGVIVVQPTNQIVIELGRYKEKANVDASIRQVIYPNGDNSVGAALKQAKTAIDKSKRIVPKVVVLLLDNKAADDVSLPSKALKDSGIGIVAIAGSGDVDQAQLNVITGSPENVVTTTSYSKLPSILGTVIEKINNGKLSQNQFVFNIYSHIDCDTASGVFRSKAFFCTQYNTSFLQLLGNLLVKCLHLALEDLPNLLVYPLGPKVSKSHCVRQLK